MEKLRYWVCPFYERVIRRALIKVMSEQRYREGGEQVQGPEVENLMISVHRDSKARASERRNSD